jgi:hypothetical protein
MFSSPGEGKEKELPKRKKMMWLWSPL